MAVELTPEELNYARKQADALRKKSTWSRRNRWIDAIAGPLWLGMGAFGFHLAGWIMTLTQGPAAATATGSSTRPGVTADFVHQIIGGYFNLTLIVLLFYICASAMCLLGLHALVKAWSDWNKHHFYSIASKLLQEKLDEIEKATP